MKAGRISRVRLLGSKIRNGPGVFHLPQDLQIGMEKAEMGEVRMEGSRRVMIMRFQRDIAEERAEQTQINVIITEKTILLRVIHIVRVGADQTRVVPLHDVL